MKPVQLTKLAFADDLVVFRKNQKKSTAQHRTPHGIKENRSENKYKENKDYNN